MTIFPATQAPAIVLAAYESIRRREYRTKGKHPGAMD
jgi:hypothetical protein